MTQDSPQPFQPLAIEAQIQRQQERAKFLQAKGRYHPSWEHDACGVGLVANIQGQPSRQVVELALEAASRLDHRGAVDADGKTGDGAGLLIDLPEAFFQERVKAWGRTVPPAGKLACGMIFLPNNNFAHQQACRVLVEREVLALGLSILGWRQVPTNPSLLGEKAFATRPSIEQILLQVPQSLGDLEQVEIHLMGLRRRIEKLVAQKQISSFALCSLSTQKVVYKGLVLASQLAGFYPDLMQPSFVSRSVVYHQRFSTNTLPTWGLAQPFLCLAHNDEINTIKGNVNWMRVHDSAMHSKTLANVLPDLQGAISHSGSDSKNLDSLFETLVRSGRSLPLAKVIAIPEAWENNPTLKESWKDLYGYYGSLLEPWDGPAAIAASIGNWAMIALDRSGFRPMRYLVDDKGMLVAGSETGLVRLDPKTIVKSGKLGPGEMLAIDFARGKLLEDAVLKDQLASEKPYRELLNKIRQIPKVLHENESERLAMPTDQLRRMQIARGMSHEDCELILHPMGQTGKEALGSMGDDSALPMLSEEFRPLSHFFRQDFSQVTNPPIDSLRERYVMSLTTRFSNLGNILEDQALERRVIEMPSPLLSSSEYDFLVENYKERLEKIDATYDQDPKGESLAQALDRMQKQAVTAVAAGSTFLVVTDEAFSPSRVMIPAALAVSAVHSKLMESNLRVRCSITLRTSDCLDPHALALAIGCGATAVCPYLSLATLYDRYQKQLFADYDHFSKVVANYKKAMDDGLLKILSKMGIGVVSSYRGGYNFEALGLSRSLVDRFFPSVHSSVSGAGLRFFESRCRKVHNVAFQGERPVLPIGGFYNQRASGEKHAWESQSIHLLQKAVREDNSQAFEQYSQLVQQGPKIALRDLLEFVDSPNPKLQREQVEPAAAIQRRFLTPGMSLGALSEEAHGTLNVAMNRIGARSVSGEGGEVRSRYQPSEDGDNANSAIKQVASGRFGVTTEYLNQCQEIEIKMAQGAKPGEGGQLMGFKVTQQIAELRHATPGVTLISPPPHHDIYSIEDLAQLIYDLKRVNPKARVCVKLVSRTGIGTIAVGVAKAGADVILISGSVGGTGASPHTSIKFAGLPWEIGLSESHQALVMSGLRNRIVLRTDGGIKTGDDVVKAALLGAEEFGIGTASLVALGCIMVRQCHSNTCPVGVCTQDETLRKFFQGKPEHVIRLFSFIAEQVRERLVRLGVASLQALVGRAELLKQVSRGSELLDDLDLNPLILNDDRSEAERTQPKKWRVEVPGSLDESIIQVAGDFFEKGARREISFPIENTQRSVGALLSSKMVRRFGAKGLQPGQLTLRLKGSAGQSFGAFGLYGLKMILEGDGNDYVGKGLSGAELVLYPDRQSSFQPSENVIAGNTLLYGATAGSLFALGRVGERFAVRNSGANAVVEGLGANGCEYMTGGLVVVLGPVGQNFGAGMTGGRAYIYDPGHQLGDQVNPDSIKAYLPENAYYQQELKQLIERHHQETGSQKALEILKNWQQAVQNFALIIPNEMLDKLPAPLTASPSQAQQVAL